MRTSTMTSAQPTSTQRAAIPVSCFLVVLVACTIGCTDHSDHARSINSAGHSTSIAGINDGSLMIELDQKMLVTEKNAQLRKLQVDAALGSRNRLPTVRSTRSRDGDYVVRLSNGLELQAMEAREE